MCLIIVAHRIVPGYELVLIGNRDEFWERPTKALGWWQSGSVLSGRDLVAGGTWLGINSAGHWAALTNYRERGTSGSYLRSRGELPKYILEENITSLDGLTLYSGSLSQYSGFNLLFGSRESMGFVSNRESWNQGKQEPGLYGLSNASLNTPWPKVSKTKERFWELVQHGEIDEQALYRILKDQSEAPDDQLPDTGVGYEWEKKLSAVCIHAPEHKYGTRSHAILSIRNDGKIRFREWLWQEEAAGEAFEFFRANDT